MSRASQNRDPLRPDAMFTLRDAFSESDLPFRVDVVMQCDLPAHWLNDIHWIRMPTPSP